MFEKMAPKHTKKLFVFQFNTFSEKCKKKFHFLFLFHPHGLERGSYYYIIIQYENRKPRKITRNEPENNVFGFNTIIKIVNSRRIKIVGKASCISVKKIVNFIFN